MNRRRWTTLALCAGLLAAPALLIALPYTFTAGQPIRASEINANFASLSDQIAALASSAQARPELIRVSVAPIYQGGTVPVLTVPGSATRPYILRQVIGGITNQNECALLFGADAMVLGGGQNTSLTMGLSVPFSPGESVGVTCSFSGNGGFVPRPMVFVFEK